MAVIGLGLDVCAIDRIRRILDGPRSERFLERVYTPAERATCSRRSDPATGYAARFAAKEALLKALGAPEGMRWQDMEVVRDEGAPRFKLTGVADQMVRRRGARVLLSMSHDANVAAATVVLDGREPVRRAPVKKRKR